MKTETMNEALQMVVSGIFEVRPDGTIWRLRQSRGKLAYLPIEPKRAECSLKNGYLGLAFWLQNKQRLVLAHRLVWTVLVGPIPEGMDINHLNGIKADNNPTNLELASRSENIKHAFRTGLAKGRPLPELKIQEAKDLRNRGLSYSQIAKEAGISQTAAWRAVNK